MIYKQQASRSKRRTALYLGTGLLFFSLFAVVVFNIFELATDDKIVDERLFSCSVIAFVVLPDCELLLFSLNRS